jgi:hypothetical protein
VALAARLVAAARGRDRLPAMGAEAARHVEASYSVERAVAGTLAALARVTGENRPG